MKSRNPINSFLNFSAIQGTSTWDDNEYNALTQENGLTQCQHASTILLPKLFIDKHVAKVSSNMSKILLNLEMHFISIIESFYCAYAEVWKKLHLKIWNTCKYYSNRNFRNIFQRRNYNTLLICCKTQLSWSWLDVWYRILEDM